MKRTPTALALALSVMACHPPDLGLDDGDEAAVVDVESELGPPPPVAPRRPGAGAIEHTVRIPRPETHQIEVQSVFPTGGAPELTLFMAVWTPGSYLVREFARHVDSLTVTTLDGAPVEVDKSRKNRWTITTGGADTVVVRYHVYARELSVRETFVDRDLAVLNAASILLCPVGDLGREHDVAFEVPERWVDVATPLPPHPDSARRFVAADYDTLVDSPIVMGDAEARSFEVGGATFELWTFGGGEVFDHDRAASDVRRIVSAEADLWGVVPFERYLFLNVLGGGGGGLEHENATLLMDSPFATRTEEDYRSWLGLVAHELFHAWNGKRLRPEELGPFDYENEVYTPSLWVVEGLTSYYDDLVLRRAGILTEAQYLERVSKNIARLERTPGRSVQSLSAASFDAWIKYYRWDEDSDNTTVSYYRKGALVGLLLDAEIRRATNGSKSLDDGMRLAFERFSGEHGYTPEQLRAVIAEATGTTLDAFFTSAVDGTGALEYGPMLDLYGYEFEAKTDDDEDEEEEEESGYLGAEVDGSSGRVVVTHVPRGTPAFAAGLNVDDEIVAIDDFRVRDLDERLARYRPGERVALLLSRRGRITRLDVELAAEPADTWTVASGVRVTPQQRARRVEWIGEGDAPAAPLAPVAPAGASPTVADVPRDAPATPTPPATRTPRPPPAVNASAMTRPAPSTTAPPTSPGPSTAPPTSPGPSAARPPSPPAPPSMAPPSTTPPTTPTMTH